MDSKDAARQEKANVPDMSARATVENQHAESTADGEVEEPEKLLAGAGVHLTNLPSEAVIESILKTPGEKIRVLGALDYLAQEPDKENIAVLPITLTAVGLVITLAADYFTENETFPLIVVIIAIIFIALALFGLLFAERRNRETTRVAARANTWARAIRGS